MNEDAVERIIASSLAGTIKVVESVQPPRGRIELKDAARYIGATLVGCAVQLARGVHHQVSRWLAFVRKIELFASLPLSVLQGEREQRSAAELSADCGHTVEMSLAVQSHAGARFTAVGGVEVAERGEFPLSTGGRGQFEDTTTAVGAEIVTRAHRIIATGVRGAIEIAFGIKHHAGARFGAFAIGVGKAMQNGFEPGPIRGRCEFVNRAAT